MLSGKNLYLEVTLGPNIQKLLRPGKLCIESGECGWIVIRKRRNRYYVYLDTGQKKEVYLGPISGFPPMPVSLTISFDGEGTIIVDTENVPGRVEEVIGAARGLATILAELENIRGKITLVVEKYRVRANP